MTDFLVQYCTEFISSVGYFGVAILMMCESMIFPIPSEAVMPFAGFLWFSGSMTLYGIVLSSTIGSIVGSLLSYYIGKWGGKPFLQKYGKYFLLNPHHLEITEHFFQKHGAKAIFICRFIPIVRHFISIPAGIGNMKLSKFIIYTTLGAGIWNFFLTYMGYLLGTQWENLQKWGHIIDYTLISIIILGILFLIFKKRKKQKL